MGRDNDEAHRLYDEFCRWEEYDLDDDLEESGRVDTQQWLDSTDDEVCECCGRKLRTEQFLLYVPDYDDDGFYETRVMSIGRKCLKTKYSKAWEEWKATPCSR